MTGVMIDAAENAGAPSRIFRRGKTGGGRRGTGK